MSANTNLQQCRPEVWGGIECTINRIGSTFRDQLEYTGHYWRYGDIAAIAQLGITHLRYPVLWERHQTSENTTINWSWADRQLRAIVDSGMTPIAGLLHHGSGPSFTNLLDNSFPEKFARYAKWVALRFPWLKNYIPINEPLTTARFSALYGHWYPHHRSDGSFCRALVNQVKAIILAVNEIRQINPNAELIQTEDLAKVHATEVLKYQADFENERRWLTYDLLCGRVDEDHKLWNYLMSSGISAKELEFIKINSCTPNVLGLNYYVTSERYLDHNIDREDASMVGGNGIHRYMDKEAYRVGCANGVGPLIAEAWERYRLPMAMSEVHLACTCDEQARWLVDVWNNCVLLKQNGVDIRAFTAWSLLGAYDWDTLLTRSNMRYECGVLDTRGNKLKMSDLAAVIQSLARTGIYADPVVQEPGWWQQTGKEQMVA